MALFAATLPYSWCSLQRDLIYIDKEYQCFNHARVTLILLRVDIFITSPIRCNDQCKITLSRQLSMHCGIRTSCSVGSTGRSSIRKVLLASEVKAVRRSMASPN